jgi:preprotein translocase subunit SecA
MLGHLREGVTAQLARVEIVQSPPLMDEDLPPMEPHLFDPVSGEDTLATARAGDGGGMADARWPSEVNPRDPSTWGKVPRNALCPCGSGQKFKHCHGKF